MTKRELLVEVEGLRARLKALELDALASAHLKKLEAAAGPFERRLSELPELEKRVGRWDREAGRRRLEEDELELWKAMMRRLEMTRLDAREVAALNQIYRQQAEVIGVLRGRIGGRVVAAKGQGQGPVAPSHLPLTEAANIVKMRLRSSGES